MTKITYLPPADAYNSPFGKPFQPKKPKKPKAARKADRLKQARAKQHRINIAIQIREAQQLKQRLRDEL